MKLQQHFENIHQIISDGRTRAIRAAYFEQLSVYWLVGAYVHEKLQDSTWGEKTVDKLADWLKAKDALLKGFDRRSLYRMQEFYLTWSNLDWDCLQNDGSVIVATTSPQLQNIENQSLTIVETLSPQFKGIPNILAKISWSHHLEILGKTTSTEEKIYYLLLSIKENYSLRELRRQLSAGLYERQKLSKHQIAGNHPAADKISQIFRDKYIFEFLNLSEPSAEGNIQKALVNRLKEFILEIGRDFTFMGQEYRIQVGKQDFYLDLLFFHRELRCLVIFELKVTSFQPEFLGKLNFYLEAVDRNVKKSYENPTIGVLLCTANDQEIVEIALSRNISPALVAEYETKLIDKKLLQQMLHEWTSNISEKQDC